MKTGSIPLSTAVPGKEYIINHINNGKTQANQFKGYGIFPGAKIKMIFTSPSKDPKAYEIMGTVIALRNEISNNIHVSPMP